MNVQLVQMYLFVPNLFTEMCVSVSVSVCAPDTGTSTRSSTVTCTFKVLDMSYVFQSSDTHLLLLCTLQVLLLRGLLQYYMYSETTTVLLPRHVHVGTICYLRVLLFFFFVTAHRLYRLLLRHYHDTMFNGFGIPQRNQHQCMGDLKDN